jgi:hypothetical protein
MSVRDIITAAAGAAAATDSVYVEDVFSTYLYTGNGAAQTITNGIDLAPATGPWTLYSSSLGSAGGGSGSQSLDVDLSGNMYIGITGSGFGYLVKLNSTGTVAWSKSFTSATEVLGVKCDSSGNVYIAFITEPAGGRTPQIIKYNSSGTLQWKKLISPLSTIGNRQYSIDVDGSGNVASAGLGYQNGGAQTPGTQILLTSSGTASWLKCVLGSGEYPHASQFGARFDYSGNIIFSGSYKSDAGSYGNLSKYNSAGSLQWNNRLVFASGAGSFTGIATDASNNIYVAGYQNNLPLLCKFDPSGALTWQRSASTSTGFSSIALHSSGDLFVSSDSGDVMRVTSAGAIVWKVKFFAGSGNFPLSCTTTDLYVKVNNASIAKLPVDGSAQSGTLNGITLGNSSVTLSASSGSLSPVTYGAGNTLTLSNSSVVEAASTVTTTSYNQAAKTTSNGLVWLKNRTGTNSNWLWDTARGAGYSLNTNTQGSQSNIGTTEGVSFTSSGFSIGNNVNWNQSGTGAVSWTFRKQPKFFDIVTYTGDGTSNRQIAHALGSTPGMVIVKCTSSSTAWPVWHRSLSGSNHNLYLNAIGASAANTVFSFDGSVSFSSTTFPVSAGGLTNNLGQTYVAYLFAHDAGGFGAAGTDSVVSCGSYTATGSKVTVNLGWEPQFILIKKSSSTGPWVVSDTMRGMNHSVDALIYANTNTAEEAKTYKHISPLPTGFEIEAANADTNFTASTTYIYLAIRRGPMKTPTDATKVFKPDFAYNTNNTIYGYLGAPADFNIQGSRGGTMFFRQRLTSDNYTTSSTTAAEVSQNLPGWSNMLGWYPTAASSVSTNEINYTFRRAPGFFDVVCQTGNGASTTYSHNLGVVPELVIRKNRNDTGANLWFVYSSSLGYDNGIGLNNNGASGSSLPPVSNVTSTTFTTQTTAQAAINASGVNYVNYLFASCPGVSKVFSFTGNGSSQTIDCGFTNGARFVLIKRTDSTGDWWVYDSARGIVSANDPALRLNSTAAEVTSADAVDPASSGFIVNQEATCNINVNSATYIGLAIA